MLKPHPQRWLLVAAGAPFLACGPPGSCPPTNVSTAWDGGLPDGGSVSSSGYLDFTSCRQICADVLPTASSCHVEDAGLVMCTYMCVGGRAPPGLVSLSGVDASPGSWLARMAELEAAAPPGTKSTTRAA